jgi:hypothetical protein
MSSTMRPAARNGAAPSSLSAAVGDNVINQDDALARMMLVLYELFRPVGLGFFPGVAERVAARERRGNSKG